MKLVVRVKLLPTPEQAQALEATLRACNAAASEVAVTARKIGCYRNYDLRKHTYHGVKADHRLGAQAAQHVIKKVADAYATLAGNLKAGRYGRPGSRRRRRVEANPFVFRPHAAQPYDARMLSWQRDTRTVSIWTTAGRLKSVAFTGSPDQLKAVTELPVGECDLVCRDGMWFLYASLVQVDAGYTSQTCHHCGHQDKHNRPDQETFRCRSCGVVAHADHNAALNITQRGVERWGAVNRPHAA